MVYKRDVVLGYFESMEKEIDESKILKRELRVSPMKNKVISVIGPRRSGKTYLLYDLKKQNGGIYLDFESIELKNLKPDEIISIINLYNVYFKKDERTIFLDEVQNLKNWESAVRSLLTRGFYVFVTGSSSKLLSKEIATQLRGRSLTYLLLPFSFREFLKARGFSQKNLYTDLDIEKIKKHLEEYLEFGGFPEIVLKHEKMKILKEYLEMAFYKDFVERHSIKSIEVAKIMFEYLFHNFSNEVSVTKIQNFIKKTLGINTRATIYEYLEKIQDTMVVFFVDKYSSSIYKRRSFPRKVYVCDVGFSKITGFSEDIGKKIENIVFLELLRRTNHNPLLEVYYWKDYQQREVDFVVKEGLRIKQLIQVTYASSLDENNQRYNLKANKGINFIIIS